MGWIPREYTSEMRVFADDLGRTIPVQWYFVPYTNKVMPYATPFGPRSDFWYDYTIGDVLGEDPTTFQRHYAGLVRKGPGLCFCGNERQWTEGCSVADPVKPVNPRTGLPCCCGPAPLLAIGGGLGTGQGLDQKFLAQEDLFTVDQENGSHIIVT